MPNLGLVDPEVGSSRNTWGNKLNDNFIKLDAVFAPDGDGTEVGMRVGLGKQLVVAGKLIVEPGGEIGVPPNTVDGDAFKADSIDADRLHLSTNMRILGRVSNLPTVPGPAEELVITQFSATFLTVADEVAAATLLKTPLLAAANVFTATPQTIQWTDAGNAEGPTLILDRKSASPSGAAGDKLGVLSLTGRNGADAIVEYGGVYAGIINAVTAAENGYLALRTVQAGVIAPRFDIAQGFYAEGVTGGDKGPGTINVVDIFKAGAPLDLVQAGAVVAVSNTMESSVITATTSDTIPNDNTKPQIGEGKLMLTRTHQPKAITNKLRIDVVIQGNPSTAGFITVALFNDKVGTPNSAIAAVNVGSPQNHPRCIAFTHFMDAPTATLNTFTVRAGMDSGSFALNSQTSGAAFGGASASSITVTEIKG